MAMSHSIRKSHSGVRRRISKACNYCRQRKIKCNGNTPCSNCKSHQVECIYTKTVRKKKKTTPVKKLTLQELDMRVNQLDAKCDLINEQLAKVISILTQNKLADKTIMQTPTPDSLPLSKMYSVTEESGFSDSESGQEVDEEGDEDEEFEESEAEEEEDDKSTNQTPIKQEMSFSPQMIPEKQTTSHQNTNQASLDPLAPQVGLNRQTPQRQSVAIDFDQIPAQQTMSQFTPNYSAYMAQLDATSMVAMSDQLNTMENRMTMAFDTVGLIGQHMEHDTPTALHY